jgi:GGDEF domain-containing protein
MFLGLDRFKLINDSLGHQVGDDLLKLAAARLQSPAVAADCVARFGGDEFLLLVHDTQTEAAAMACAARVQTELRQPWLVALTALTIVNDLPPPEAATWKCRRAGGEFLRWSDKSRMNASEKENRWCSASTRGLLGFGALNIYRSQGFGRCRDGNC